MAVPGAGTPVEVSFRLFAGLFLCLCCLSSHLWVNLRPGKELLKWDPIPEF